MSVAANNLNVVLVKHGIVQNNAATMREERTLKWCNTTKHVEYAVEILKR